MVSPRGSGGEARAGVRVCHVGFAGLALGAFDLEAGAAPELPHWEIFDLPELTGFKASRTREIAAVWLARAIPLRAAAGAGALLGVHSGSDLKSLKAGLPRLPRFRSAIRAWGVARSTAGRGAS